MQNIGRCSIVRMGNRYGFSTTSRSVCGRHEVIWAEGGDTFENGDDLTLVGQLREDGSVEMVGAEESGAAWLPPDERQQAQDAMNAFYRELLDQAETPEGHLVVRPGEQYTSEWMPFTDPRRK